MITYFLAKIEKLLFRYQVILNFQKDNLLKLSNFGDPKSMSITSSGFSSRLTGEEYSSMSNVSTDLTLGKRRFPALQKRDLGMIDISYMSMASCKSKSRDCWIIRNHANNCLSSRSFITSSPIRVTSLRGSQIDVLAVMGKRSFANFPYNDVPSESKLSISFFASSGFQLKKQHSVMENR